jgi:EpsI family protein
MSSITATPAADLDSGKPPQPTLAILLLSLLLLFGAAVATYMRPVTAASQPKLDVEAMIPSSFGDWKIDPTVLPVLMSTDVQDTLNEVYDAVASRTYVNGKGERMMLSVGWTGQQAGKQKPHWQEICYRAQGFRVEGIKRQATQVAGRSIPVTTMVASQRGRVEPVTYWLTLGDKVVADRNDRFMHLLRMSLARKTTDGFLVRVSSINPDAPAAYAAQLRFMEEMLAQMPPAQAARLVGALR